jgi:hypothetical protein
MSTTQIDTGLNGLAVTASIDEGYDAYKGKALRPYVAHIKGPGQRFSLDRSFLRVKPELSGDTHVVLLPARNGIYEVRDYPETQKRTRYYQVNGGKARYMYAPDDDEVLEAVECARQGEWSMVSAAAADTPMTTPEDAIKALDECVQALENDNIDKEDVLMELDKVRRVLEQME